MAENTEVKDAVQRVYKIHRDRYDLLRSMAREYGGRKELFFAAAEKLSDLAMLSGREDRVAVRFDIPAEAFAVLDAEKKRTGMPLIELIFMGMWGLKRGGLLGGVTYAEFHRGVLVELKEILLGLGARVDLGPIINRIGLLVYTESDDVLIWVEGARIVVQWASKQTRYELANPDCFTRCAHEVAADSKPTAASPSRASDKPST